MNLKELKQMIKEEFEAFTEADDVSVDVDAEEMAADKNPEDTLKKVFDMLKDYFEGDEENMEDEMEEDMMGEVKDDDKMEEDADLDESDGYTGKAGKGGTGYDAKVGGKGRTGYDAGSKALQERFQRLANIIK